MHIQKLVIETDGTVGGTVIKINDEPIGAVQEISITVKADPDSLVTSSVKYWRKVGDVTPLKVSDLIDAYSGMFGVYVTPFTGQLMLEEDILEFDP